MPLLIQEKINEHASWALWEISEDKEALLQQLSLSREEQEELHLIQLEKKKLEWLASRILIKNLVKSQLAGSSDPKVVKDEHGKPYLPDSTAKVSLSHSFPYAAAILHEQREVGIDIEHPREQLLRIRKKFLSTGELADAGDKLEKLCVYWTAKEALYKLYGRRGLIFQEQILVQPFMLSESGSLKACLLLNKVKYSYTLHYRCFKSLHICYSL